MPTIFPAMDIEWEWEIVDTDDIGKWVSLEMMKSIYKNWSLEEKKILVIALFEAPSLKVQTSYGHAIALWKKRCGIDQKRLII